MQKEEPPTPGSYLTTYITQKGQYFVNSQRFSGAVWSKQHRCPVVAWRFFPEPYNGTGNSWIDARKSPEIEGTYIVTYLTYTGRKHVNTRWFTGLGWAKAQGGTVIAWQPLPMPFAGKNMTNKQHQDANIRKTVSLLELIKPLSEFEEVAPDE